jgi:hypothetical protein
VTPSARLTAGTVAFADNGADADTLTRSQGSWLSDGFAPGQTIAVSGSGLNEGTYRIAAISADGRVLTLTADAALVNEQKDVAALQVRLAPAVVRAQGNVAISAEGHTEIDLIAGNITGAGTASVGAAAAVPVVNKETEAFVGREAIVDAKAGRDAINANSGGFAIAFVDEPIGLDVPEPLFFVTGALSGDINFDGTDDLTEPSITQQRTSTLQTQAIKGVAVSAVSQDDIETVAISGVAPTVAVNIGGSVNVLSSETTASSTRAQGECRGRRRGRRAVGAGRGRQRLSPPGHGADRLGSRNGGRNSGRRRHGGQQSHPGLRRRPRCGACGERHHRSG